MRQAIAKTVVSHRSARNTSRNSTRNLNPWSRNGQMGVGERSNGNLIGMPTRSALVPSSLVANWSHSAFQNAIRNLHTATPATGPTAPLPVANDQQMPIAAARHDDNFLTVRWQDNSENKYPHIFLRDNCWCDKCFHHSSLQRTVNTCTEIPLEVKPKAVVVSADGKTVDIEWANDGHHSVFSASWLRERAYEVSSQLKDILREMTPTLWASDLNGNIPVADFNGILEDDSQMEQFISHMIQYGVVLVQRVPKAPGQIEMLSKRVGFIRPSNYGFTFQVKTIMNPSSLAYTSFGLDTHTDLPYYEYTPGVQTLHCISQEGKGGENTLTDGFRVAEDLRQMYPEYFDTLSQVGVTYNNVGRDYYEYNLIFKKPVIKVDSNGKIVEVCYNNPVRSSVMDVPPEEMVKFYRAYYQVAKMLKDPKYQITHRMDPGQMLVFNNRRVLHGRTTIVINAGAGVRHLEGGYMDWDDILSHYRVIKGRGRSQEARV